MPNSDTVKIMKGTVAFPLVCPHCLEPASVNMPIQSAEVFAGYYVLFTKWKHSTVYVPFCAKYARRGQRAFTISIATAFGLLATYIAIALITMRAIEGREGALAFLIFIGIFWLPSLLVRPQRHIKLLSSDDNHVHFKIRDTRYAKLLAAANGMTQPETKKDEDGQSFAA